MIKLINFYVYDSQGKLLTSGEMDLQFAKCEKKAELEKQRELMKKQYKQDVKIYFRYYETKN